jgi:hypothetical protein
MMENSISMKGPWTWKGLAVEPGPEKQVVGFHGMDFAY